VGRAHEREVLEVEVERLPAADDPRRGAARARAGSDRKPLHPLRAGVLIDLLDVATMGTAGLYFGLPLGLAVGYYLGRRMGLARRRSLGLALLCGIYCFVPGTAVIPLGTLVGAYRVLGR
jgi:hypothetical protein